jgi:hypothetical protein
LEAIHNQPGVEEYLGSRKTGSVEGEISSRQLPVDVSSQFQNTPSPVKMTNVEYTSESNVGAMGIDKTIKPWTIPEYHTEGGEGELEANYGSLLTLSKTLPNRFPNDMVEKYSSNSGQLIYHPSTIISSIT